MAQKGTAKPQDLKETRQKKLIERLKKKENWMKWALIAALIVILLLLLFIGYATDWTTGLIKDSASTPISTSLDSAKTATGTGSTGSTGSTGGSTSTGESSTNKTSTGTGTSSTTNNTTNNSTTTTTNNPTPTPTPTPTPASDGLLTLYANANAGGNLDALIGQANGLGVSTSCSNALLIRNCTFSLNNESFTTKSLLDTNLITSVLKNF